MNRAIVFCAAAAVAGIASAGEALTGDAAAAKFPASLRGMGLDGAKWMQLTNGVEYYYGRFSNLLGTVDGFTGSRNDLHMLRIDYKNAPVKMKFVDHTQTSTKRWTTSKTAAQHNALFAINMTMEDGNGGPQGYAKADGVEIPSRQTTAPDGFAFNDDKTYKFDRKWLDVDPETGKPKAGAWANVVSHEAYTIHNGVATWGANATFPRANYTFFGATADGVLWACAVDGRREGVSEGLAYHEVAALQLELGCTGGVCCDGGGSTTMAIRKDVMTASDICDTQKTSADSSDYYTMNYLSGRQKEVPILGTITIDPVGTERAVINQLLFVPAPLESRKPRVAFYVD
ncbi:MAG: phosphodiester glycosidase family protein [Kiritimatiellae bacterium]|nr:phosphodiester glycosidase family protein [Kiritimatiellia bacterium]